jgi:hypothetical protein
VTIVDHLRAVLAIQNPKHFRSAHDQYVLEAAQRYLDSLPTPSQLVPEDWTRPVWGYDEDPEPVADQRATFIQALQAAPVAAPDAQGATQLGSDPERAATGSMVRSTGCSEMEQVPE